MTFFYEVHLKFYFTPFVFFAIRLAFIEIKEFQY